MRVGIELVVPTRRRSAGGTWDSSGGAILGRGLLYAVRQVEGRRAVLYYSNGDELESAYGAARTPLCSVRGRELAGTGTTGAARTASPSLGGVSSVVVQDAAWANEEAGDTERY